MTNFIEAIKEILPEAKPLVAGSFSKWTYKNYEICIPCAYIVNHQDKNERYRFKVFDIKSFRELLMEIKNKNENK